MGRVFFMEKKMTRVLENYRKALKPTKSNLTETVAFRCSAQDKKAIVAASKASRRSMGGYLVQLHRIAIGEVPVG